jgi:hypothetical protein
MSLTTSSLIVSTGALAVVWLAGIVVTDRSNAQTVPPKGQTAGEVFKNVTTASLKGLSVDDFLAAMGLISDDLAMNCGECHPGAGTNKADWVTDPPRKQMARKMIDMLAAINKNSFGGRSAVTCYTCHHGRPDPPTTIALDKLYGPPNDEQDDIVAPASQGPTANQILDKYIAALGGAEKLATLKSFVATGTSVGYGDFVGSFHIYAQAPDHRTIDIQFTDTPGNATWAFNGRTGWITSPRGLLKDYDVTGSELNGQKLDAEMAFPGQIKQVLTGLRVGAGDTINERSVDVVQGTGPGGGLATLYFDTNSGLLVRMVRYGRTPLGRVPVQYDYDDYRDVSGIKFPFKYTFSWLDGKQAFQLSQVQVNAPIQSAVFDKHPSGGK